MPLQPFVHKHMCGRPQHAQFLSIQAYLYLSYEAVRMCRFRVTLRRRAVGDSYILFPLLSVSSDFFFFVGALPLFSCWFKGKRLNTYPMRHV